MIFLLWLLLHSKLSHTGKQQGKGKLLLSLELIHWAQHMYLCKNKDNVAGLAGVCTPHLAGGCSPCSVLAKLEGNRSCMDLGNLGLVLLAL